MAGAAGTKYAYDFDPDEKNNTAAGVYALARRGGPRVLDVGSGPGIVAAALARDGGKDVTCLDLDADALAHAREAGVGSTHVADLRDPEWYAGVRDRPFDTVILADVLEHLVDPDRILRDIRREGLVADDGRLVVSIPNANHESVLVELVTGHFRYTRTGLLDGTHLRFFTLESITALLEACGFTVVEVHRTIKDLGHTPHNYRLQELPETVRAALPALGLQARTYQYVLLVRPGTETARIVTLTEELEAARQALHVARVQADALRRRLEAVQALLEEERAETARAAAAAADQRDLEAELALARTELEKARRETRAIRESPAYRAGLALRRAGEPLLAARRELRRRGGAR